MTPDHSEFTFWPDPREAMYISTHSAKDISLFMHDYPELLPAYLHELWRIDQVEKMYESLKTLQVSFEVRPIDILVKEGPIPMAYMCLVEGVPIEEASKFLSKAFEVTYKVEQNIAFQDTLTSDISNKITLAVDSVMSPIKDMLRKSRAKLN